MRARAVAQALMLALGALLLAAPTLAVQPDEVLKDPALEQRARDISAGLRCLVCQNQSIDESDAPLAKDLRGLVRERLKTGETNQQVRDFVVQRYGEFVLLRPVFGVHTALLWLTPLLVIALGGVGLWLALKRRHPAPSALSEAEQAGLDALLRKERSLGDRG
jgi:cytochrome c-type biogenesis protein CcmH